MMNDASWRQWCLDLASPDAGLHFHLLDRTRCGTTWRIPHRRLDHHLLYVVQRGMIDASFEREQVRIGPWTALWLAPEVAHEFRMCSPDVPPVLYHCRFSVNSTVAIPEYQVIPGIQEHEWLMAQLLDAWRHQPPLRQERLAWLLALFFSGMATERLRDRIGGLDAEQRRRIHDWLEAHIEHDPTPADLATVVGLSSGWFARQFKRSYGESPRVWLKQQRIRRAARLLEDGNDAVSSIAARLGYSDIFNFSKQFKSVLGTSPTQYRDRLRWQQLR